MVLGQDASLPTKRTLYRLVRPPPKNIVIGPDQFQPSSNGGGRLGQIGGGDDAGRGQGSTDLLRPQLLSNSRHILLCRSSPDLRDLNGMGGRTNGEGGRTLLAVDHLRLRLLLLKRLGTVLGRISADPELPKKLLFQNTTIRR